MTMPPPTAESGAPARLPDDATLTRMAGEFFRALPGQGGEEIAGGIGGEAMGMAEPLGSEPSAQTPEAAVKAEPRVPMPMPMAAPASMATLPAPGLPSSLPSNLPTTHPSVPPTGLAAELPNILPNVLPTGLPTGLATDPSISLPFAPSADLAAGPSTNPPFAPAMSPPPVPPAGFSTALPFRPPLGHATTTPTRASAAPPISGASAPPGPYYFLTEAPAHPAPQHPDFAPYYFIQEPAVPTGFPLDPHPAFDVHAVRRDFPILSELVNGHPLIWLDNAATTQKPQPVINRLVEFYSRENSNIHRAAHELAARATDAYEDARRTVARFIGAGSAEEIVFVRGSTEAINLVAKAWGPGHVRAGDEIVISHLEHHANIVPWQMLARQTGAVIKVIPVDESGQLLLDEYSALLSDRTKIVAVTHLSNALGTVVPIEQVIELAHRVGARVLVDAAQSVPHVPVDVAALDADFLVFSGHKVFGPTGVGVLYGKREVLEDTAPWEGGGNMISDVTLERSSYQPPPGRFEAGTGNIADAAGLAAALDYVGRLGLPNIAAYEHALVEHATEGLRGVPGLRLIGTAPHKASIVSFVLDGYQPIEVGAALNEKGIAVRAGHHCAQPILRRLGVEATVRPSFAFYNTHDEVDTLIEAVHRLADHRGRR